MAGRLEGEDGSGGYPDVPVDGAELPMFGQFVVDGFVVEGVVVGVVVAAVRDAALVDALLAA